MGLKQELLMLSSRHARLHVTMSKSRNLNYLLFSPFFVIYIYIFLFYKSTKSFDHQVPYEASNLQDVRALSYTTEYLNLTQC